MSTLTWQPGWSAWRVGRATRRPYRGFCPAPASEGVLDLSPQKERSKTRGRSSAAIPSPVSIKGEIEYFRNAVRDLTYTVEDQIAEGDKVVTRYTARGTHQGEFFGVAGTGKRIEMSGISIDRFEEGKLVEEWPEYDLLGTMRQVGAIPDSEQAASS